MDAMEIPVPDSQFRLRQCGFCGNQKAGYQCVGKSFRVKCGSCGKHTSWRRCRHDAQIEWNSRFGVGDGEITERYYEEADYGPSGG